MLPACGREPLLGRGRDAMSKEHGKKAAARSTKAAKGKARRGEKTSPSWFDPCSSAPWFDGWATPLSRREPWMRRVMREPSPVAAATTWLATTGWRLHGPLATSRPVPRDHR